MRTARLKPNAKQAPNLTWHVFYQSRLRGIEVLRMTDEEKTEWRAASISNLSNPAPRWIIRRNGQILFYEYTLREVMARIDPMPTIEELAVASNPSILE